MKNSIYFLKQCMSRLKDSRKYIKLKPLKKVITRKIKHANNDRF